MLYNIFLPSHEQNRHHYRYHVRTRNTNQVMRKFLSLMMIGLIAVMAWSCDDDDDKNTPISFSDLPKTAQNFLNEYYPSDKVVSIDREGKHEGTEYDVRMASGHEVEFDVAGQWTDVDAPAQQYVPEGIVPEPIRQYVTENFQAFGINEISREKYGYEVELTSGLELRFDHDGIFIGHLD